MLVGVQNGTAMLKDSSKIFFIKLNILLPYALAKALLGIYPKELTSCVHTNLHLSVYIGFIYNCQNLEATKISFGGKRINTLWSFQTVKYYSVLTRNELPNHEKTEVTLMHVTECKKPV